MMQSDKPTPQRSHGWAKQILIAVSLLIMIAMYGVASYTVYVSQKEDVKVFDFFPRWYGAQEMLQNENPYTEAINREILDEMGWDWQPYRHSFLYPATVTYILLPFWLLPWTVSISLWTGITLGLFISLPIIVFLILNWRIPPLQLLLVIIFSTFIFRHSFHTYLFGQFFAVILGSLILAWWGVLNKRPWLVAIALVVATVRPDGAIIAAAFLFDLLLTRRFKILGIWGAIMGTFFVLSLIQIGWWVPDMMDSVNGYRTCCLYTEPAQILSDYPLLQQGSRVVVGLWAAAMLFHMRSLPDITRIPWSLSTVMLAYLLIFPQSKDYTLVYGLLPAWMVIWSSKGRWYSLLPILIILASPWFYLQMGWMLTEGNPVEQFTTPIFLGILLTWHYLEWRNKENEPESIQSPFENKKAQLSDHAPA